jgi:tetracycline resistance efflux pump
MEKKSTKIAYFVALGVFVVLLAILGFTFKDAPIIVEGAATPFAGTFWSLLPPIVAIVLALISKEVYSSLFLGCLVGALLVSNYKPWETLVQLVEGDNGIVTTVSDAGNIAIIVFLVVLGIMVDLMNKTGGSEAFGRWATKTVHTRAGAQLMTMLLGVLIFIDDYFNCLTVGAVMRPVTESHKISRAKLAYVIDSTAAPVCMIAPVSSWAAAVSGYVQSDSVNGIQLFVAQIPWNYYCLLTLLMIVVISILNIDYGPMLTHEYNAQVKDDLFTTPERPFAGADDYETNSKVKSSVIDLILPVVVLIATCIIGLIYTGGFFDTESGNYHAFASAFSDASSGAGLAIGSMLALVFTYVYYWLRGSIGFEKSFESVPQGFIQMISPILILSFAWTLCGLTRYGMNSADFVISAMSGAGSLAKFLPAMIFIIGAAIGFATGTSWGTIGIMAPIVVQVFNYDQQPVLCTIGLAAACAGGVMGDHCSPISDTTIMASAGAHCYHLNHVFTQIPYALTVAGVSFVSFILAGLIQNVVICLIIAAVLMVATLLVIKAIMAKKHQGIFQEMAEADKALAK